MKISRSLCIRTKMALPRVSLVLVLLIAGLSTLPVRAQNPTTQAPAPSAPASTLPTTPQAATPQHHHEPTAVAPRSTVDMLDVIKKRGKLRVGVSEIIPWTMHDKDGKWIGFEVDVARKLARDMGVQVEFFPAPFHALIPDLLKGRTDIIISGLSIEAHRALVLNFSAPYNSTAVTLAANAKSSGARKSMADFNKPEVTVGALEGSTAEEMSGILLPNARIRVYDEDDQLFQDLIAGKLDAAVADSPRPEIVANLFPAHVVLPALPPLATFPAAFAVRRGDMDFVNFLNSWIAARTDNGWLENRRTYWFKGTEWTKDL